MVLKFENIPRHSFFSLWCIKAMKLSTCGSAAPHLACVSKNLENKVCYSKTFYF